MYRHAPIISIFLLIQLVFPLASFAATSLCAQVKIEIKQELTLERQAFDAHMRINNGLALLPLENVNVDVTFEDADGNPVLASSDPNASDAGFFIRIESLENINAVNGSGIIAPLTSADIHWLIIPAPGAANGFPQGTLYYVGATLSYTLGGEERVKEVLPDFINVKPMPELTLDYFLPLDVYGDDAFTAEVEPSEPFSLGVRVKNNGAGTARNVQIESAQPKIVENKFGLLVGFVIEGAEINGQPSPSTLSVNFGDISPNDAGIGRWLMSCRLSGKFVDFTADFSHSDELGGQLTSIIGEIQPHTLIHDVLVDLPGRDAGRDFLASENGEVYVYESDNIDTPVSDQSYFSYLSLVGETGSSASYTISVPETSGFGYVKLEDPYDGEKIIREVIRSDGKKINRANIWLSKTRDNNQVWRYFVNLFDANMTGSYTFVFTDAEDGPDAPVLEFIPDVTGTEDNQLSFTIKASDPDGTFPALSASNLPALAQFADQGDGTAIFSWTPSEGQSGEYLISYTAHDGTLYHTRQATLTVLANVDSDGDGAVDSIDACPNDPEKSSSAGQCGCGISDADPDADMVADCNDLCPGSNEGDDVNPDGCSVSQLNHPPVADAGPDQIADAGVIVTLGGTNSHDPDAGDQLNYLWEQISPDAPLLAITDPFNSETSFMSPGVNEEGVAFIFRLKVTDSDGESAHDYCVVNVSSENQPPVANAGADQVVGPGEDITLDASESSDPEDGVLSYEWDLISPPLNGYSSADMRPVFSGPETNGVMQSLKFLLTVTDAGGLISQDEVIINIGTDNLPPVADAGPPQSVNPGDTVTLDGSQSYDPDDSVFSYKWTHLRGTPPVTLQSTEKDHSRIFIAPEVGYGKTILTFLLTATDYNGFQSTSVTEVDVAYIDTIAPEVTAPDDVTVEATGPQTLVETGQATAFDEVGVVELSSDSPIDYPVGPTVVTWTAKDEKGNTGSAIQTITVTDTTPPVITGVDSIVTEATGVETPISLGAITAIDLVDGLVDSFNNATAAFPLGDTSITWTAADSLGNTSTTTQLVTITDTTGPVLTLPPELTVEASSIMSVVNIGSATATDIFGVTVVNDAPATYPIGKTSVNWTATDGNGLTSIGTQLITVIDTTAPELFLPADVTVYATGMQTSVDIGKATAADIFGVKVESDMPHSYPLGQTIVTWTATDGNGLITTDTQIITILPRILEMTYSGDMSAEWSDRAIFRVDLSDDTEDAFAGTVANEGLVSYDIKKSTGEIVFTSDETPANAFLQWPHPLLDPNLPSGMYKLYFNSYDPTGVFATATLSQPFSVQPEKGVIEYSGDQIASIHDDALYLQATLYQEENEVNGTLIDYDNARNDVMVQFHIYKFGQTPVAGGAGAFYSSEAVLMRNSAWHAGVAFGGLVVPLDTLGRIEENYVVMVELPNPDYIDAAADEATATVYDPDGRFFTGGGFIETLDGVNNNFGFTFKYSRRGRAQGNLVFILRDEEVGTKLRVKSNMLDAAGFPTSADDIPTAIAEGKCNIEITDLETNELIEGQGNLTFDLLVEDRGPNGADEDTFKLEVRYPDGVPHENIFMDELEVIKGGNIVVHDFSTSGDK